MPDDVKATPRYQKLLEQIRAAYVSAQTGALRPSVWKREGASSYTVKREQLLASTSERGRPMPDDVKPWTEEEERELRTDVEAHWDTHDDDIRGAFATLDAERAKVAALTAERDELKAWQVAQREWEAVASKVILDVTRLAHDNAALTKVLRALIESMPECWRCEELATHWHAGSYVNALRLEAGLAKLGNEEACSKHSGGGPEMTRASSIRAAVALLAKQREET